MRLAHVLRQAGAERASAVLLLSGDSTINFEAALQVRLLNPSAEIVVRSTSRLADLCTLLEHRLPGVGVVDPLLLCAEPETSWWFWRRRPTCAASNWVILCHPATGCGSNFRGHPGQSVAFRRSKAWHVGSAPGGSGNR
ncbi:MAG: hypothetical protein RLZZ206_3305 [Cyanobacteriota bacterium]|jgi:hypothetical protein